MNLSVSIAVSCAHTATVVARTDRAVKNTKTTVGHRFERARVARRERRASFSLGSCVGSLSEVSDP
jgi:hypothetical protein